MSETNANEFRRPLPVKVEKRDPTENLVNPNPAAPGHGPAFAPDVPPKDTAFLKRIAKRAAEVTHEELSHYIPTNAVVKLTELVLSGVVRRPDMAAELGISPDTVSVYLSDPVACAWLMRQISGTIGDRLAMVDAAMYNRALGGDVAAAKLIFERYAPTVQVHRHVHAASDELAQLSDAELLRLAAGSKVIDVEAVEAEKDDEEE